MAENGLFFLFFVVKNEHFSTIILRDIMPLGKFFPLLPFGFSYQKTGRKIGSKQNTTKTGGNSYTARLDGRKKRRPKEGEVNEACMGVVHYDYYNNKKRFH